MEKKHYLILSILTGVLIFLIYRNFFSLSLLISTDLPYLQQLEPSFLHLLPKAWDAQRNAGMGGVYTPFLWYFFVVNLPSLVLSNVLHIPWEITERVVLFFPFLLFGATFSYLYIYTKTKNILSALLGVVVMLANSYVLMLTSGGQMQILLGVSLIPLLLFLFESYLEEKYLSQKLSMLSFAGVLSLIGMYDMRVMFLAGLIIALRGVLYLLYTPKLFLRLIIVTSISGVTFLLLHMFWILPTILHRSNPIDDLGPAFNSVASVKFLSFSTFEYPFSLLHPLWPNNIFGQVPFFLPLFLFIPLLAFSPFMFLEKNNKNKSIILFASFLILCGAFLAKGATDPFGNIYIWLFSHVPGFELFRDSTKFYAFIIIGYLILIPLGYLQIVNKLKMKESGQIVFFILFVCIFIGPLIPGFIKGLPGTFRYQIYPVEYQEVLSMLERDKSFSRVLWFPEVVPFSPFSNRHPGISAKEYFKTYSLVGLKQIMKRAETKSLLLENSTKYIILPSDIDNSLYVTDRSYDPNIYSDMRSFLDSLAYLTKVRELNGLVIYRIEAFLPHISLRSKQSVSVSQDAFWQYNVKIPKYSSSDMIIFAETYDADWVLRSKQGGKQIFSHKYGNNMSFSLKDVAGTEFTLYYHPQTYVFSGLLISILSFIIYMSIIGFEVYLWKRK